MKKKLVYIISDINKSLAFEWISEELKDEYELVFILISAPGTELEKYLTQHNVRVFRLDSPKRNISLRLTKAVFQIIKDIRPDIVHTHLVKANIAGILASFILGIKKRVYTRHHSDFHHVYHPRAVYSDRLVNRMSTDIIAISKVVKDVLVEKEMVDERKIQIIHHGFKLELFEQGKPGGIRKRYGYEGQGPVVGVISRYLELKGLQYIIPAYREFLKEYPDACLVIANAKGNYSNTVKELLASIPPSAYREIEFESDLPSLYSTFDMFIHAPITPTAEAFGQVYVESLASGIPLIASLSGIAGEFLEDKKNALVVPYKDQHSITEAMKLITSDAELRARLISEGRSIVRKMFNLENMTGKLKALYDR